MPFDKCKKRRGSGEAETLTNSTYLVRKFSYPCGGSGSVRTVGMFGSVKGRIERWTVGRVTPVGSGWRSSSATRSRRQRITRTIEQVFLHSRPETTGPAQVGGRWSAPLVILNCQKCRVSRICDCVATLQILASSSAATRAASSAFEMNLQVYHCKWIVLS